MQIIPNATAATKETTAFFAHLQIFERIKKKKWACKIENVAQRLIVDAHLWR